MIGLQHAVLPLPVQRHSESHIFFSRVVAGIDFSSASLAAARWATEHVARNARAIVSHVVPPPEGDWGDDRFDRAQLRELQLTNPTLFGGLDAFATTLKVASVRAIVRIGRASHWLNALVTNARASLLVLGRRIDANRRGVGEPNVLERSARRTQASVLVVPEGMAEGPRHIIAAVDESDMSERVLLHADALAQMHECPLVVLHVVPPTLGTYARVLDAPRGRTNVREQTEAAVTAQRQPMERAERWLTTLTRDRRLSSRPQIVVRSGDPVRETVASTREFAAPLVIVGKRGVDHAPRGSIGSVARELLTRTRIPVLAVSDHDEE